MDIEKMFNWISGAMAVAGGLISKYLGGFDTVLKMLMVAIVLDYTSGLLKAMYNKSLSSEIGYKGICKKVYILLVIAAATIVQQIVGDTFPIREVTICFFLANELISLLENAAQTGLPLPEKLKEFLLQIRDRNKGGNENV